MHQSTWKMLWTRWMLPESWKEPAWFDVLLLITVAIWMSDSKLSSTCHERKTFAQNNIFNHFAEAVEHKSNQTRFWQIHVPWSLTMIFVCPCKAFMHKDHNFSIFRWSVICHSHSLACMSSLISKCEWTSSHWKSLMFAKQDSHTCEVHVSHCVEKT